MDTVIFFIHRSAKPTAVSTADADTAVGRRENEAGAAACSRMQQQLGGGRSGRSPKLVRVEVFGSGWKKRYEFFDGGIY